MATIARRKRKHAEGRVLQLESTAGVPKNCGKRLAAPINFHLFQHVVKCLLDIKHTPGCTKLQLFSTQTPRHAWVEVARMFQEVQAKGL